MTTQFTYNGDGDRLAQTVNGVRTNYALDPMGLAQVLIEHQGSQSIAYLPSLGQYDTAWSYYLPDRLGSVRQLANTTGQVTLARSYDPFGNLLEQTGAGQSNFGYTGEQVDPTGLVFLRARYYNPYLNRFISPDTIIPDPTQSQSWNRYNYVGNNPINYTDPSGHCIVQYSGEVRMGQAPYGTSGLCPHTESVATEGAYAVTELYTDSSVNSVMLLENCFCQTQDRLIPYLPHGTLSIQLPSISFGAGIAGRGGPEFGFDNQGNLIILRDIGGGGMAPTSGSLAVSIKFTNAPTVDEISKWSVQLGGSAGEGIAVGVEWVFFGDDEGNRYNGLAISVGPSGKAPIPAEVHGTAEYGKILYGPYNYRVTAQAVWVKGGKKSGTKGEPIRAKRSACRAPTPFLRAVER